tara:strand:- start:52 stop:570 length:519 start_codon:yes stop_codon:yes gene_type:complete
MVLSMKRSFKRGGARSRTRSGKKFRGNPTFAAKLGAFMLESVKSKILFSTNGGFSNKHPQVYGVLPYLHMNIKDSSFRNTLKLTKSVRHKELTKLCKSKKLDKTLNKVNFNCNTQPGNGIQSVNNSIMDSINNRWGIRHNGRKRLREILKAQKWQMKQGIIPAKSLEWAKGL